MEQLQLCLEDTNTNLRNNRKRETNTTELYNLFWIPAVKVGAVTGMPRQRFNDLWSALRWSYQIKDRPIPCWSLLGVH